MMMAPSVLLLRILLMLQTRTGSGGSGGGGIRGTRASSALMQIETLVLGEPWSLPTTATYRNVNDLFPHVPVMLEYELADSDIFAELKFSTKWMPPSNEGGWWKTRIRRQHLRKLGERRHNPTPRVSLSIANCTPTADVTPRRVAFLPLEPLGVE